MTLSPVPTDLDTFLAFDNVIDVHEGITSKAAEITDGILSDIDKAKVLFEWVRDNIPHSKDALRDEVTCSATEVFNVGTGICYAKAHLLAAMMRSQRIPCGFCYQVYANPESKIPDTLAEEEDERNGKIWDMPHGCRAPVCLLFRLTVQL